MRKTIEEPGVLYYTTAVFVLLFVLGSVYFWGGLPFSKNGIDQIFNYASAATSSSVTVSANVTTNVSCSTDNSSTAFGTLTSSAISTSTPNASTTMTTNDGLGLTFYVNDSGNGVNGGLSTSSPVYLIPSPVSGFPATSTLSIGTEGYGIQATSSAGGSGGTLGFVSRYNVVGLFGINAIGGLTTTTQIIASSTSAVSGRLVVVTHKAAASASTQAASYTDTVTYTCIGN